MRGLAVLWLVCASATAYADDPKTEAKQHLQRAIDLHKDKKYAEALDEMKTSYALDPQPDLLYAIAQLHVQLGQCDRALPFYERFLDSKPKDSAAAKARQAIEICKTDPPAAVQQPPLDPALDQLPPTPPPTERPVATVTAKQPWYRDIVGDVLVGLGVVGSAVGVISYVGARSDNSAAASAASYPDRVSLLDSARDQRRIALVAGGVGAALVVAGVLKFTLGSRKQEHRVVVVPTTQGGTLAWSRAF